MDLLEVFYDYYTYYYLNIIILAIGLLNLCFILYGHFKHKKIKNKLEEGEKQLEELKSKMFRQKPFKNKKNLYRTA